MKEIIVTVSGSANTGKSAIAEYIRLKLEEIGITAKLTDDNGIGIVDEKPGVIANSVHERLTSIRDKGTLVNIATSQRLRQNSHDLD